MKSGPRRILVCLAIVALAACATGRDTTRRNAAPHAPVLRIAVAPGTPPYAFDQGGELVGLEIDFARELATALGRPLELVGTEWEDLIPTLRAGRADLVMSGMTITRAREVQIAFSDPYLRSGLLALTGREEASRFTRVAAVLATAEPVGVVKGTTAERFVREHMPRASVMLYPTIKAAISELRTRRVTLVVHDAPVAIWFAGGDEANLSVLLDLLNEEPLGWGMRRDDEALRSAVDGVLARWRSDGTRDRILGRWLPYWQRLESRPVGS